MKVFWVKFVKAASPSLFQMEDGYVLGWLEQRCGDSSWCRTSGRKSSRTAHSATSHSSNRQLEAGDGEKEPVGRARGMHHTGNKHMLGSDVGLYRERCPLIDSPCVVNPLKLPKFILYASPWHASL